ncbi:peptide deformylase [Nonomuraea sp. CA-143628]|uniref:peptide deformylase n=1 Tax=Nonomuraea sp. CA-143628 TaxID=3239997 RepID=UPI003D94B68C
MIQTRDDLDRSWSWVSDYGDADNPVAGRGVEDDAPGTPHDFGRATFDAYLDHLVATAPGMVEYFLFEDDDDTEWRVLVWDVPATGYDQMRTVPTAGDRARRQYPLAMAADGVVPQATSTWPGTVVRRRLQAKAASLRSSDRMKAAGILQVGDPILAAVATPFDLPAEADQAREVINALFAALQRIRELHVFAKGVGLAAPQIGIGRAAAIVIPHDPDADAIVLLNPRIINASAEADEQYEGCLSFFDVRGMVPRPLTLEAEHTTLNGKTKITAFPYELARLVAHEIDHLAGRLYTSRMREGVKPIPVEEYRGIGQPWKRS